MRDGFCDFTHFPPLFSMLVYERERWLPDVDTTLVPMKQRSTVLKSSKLKDWIEQRRTEAPSSTTNNKEALSNAPLMAKKPGDRSSAPSGEVDKKSNGSMTTMDSGAKKMLLERFFTDPKVALKMVRMEMYVEVSERILPDVN